MPTTNRPAKAAQRAGKGRAPQKMTRQAARHKPEKKPRDKQTMLMYGVIALMVLLAALVVFWPPNFGAPYVYKIETNKGDIVVNVYPKVMPITAANFERLVSENFYDGLKFHRMEDWVVQGGDPDGTGAGGPGWTIPLEIHSKFKHVRGALGMARSLDPDSAGSQFYFIKKAQPTLDGSYAVFGKVVQGMDVVDKLAQDDVMTRITRLSPAP
jgi:peptidyl-prolyl cis-trans isomerase B (cyclophilin B)